MAVTSKANATAIFDLKSAALTVLALLLKTDDLGVLAEALDQRFGATPGLFEHEPLCIDLSLLREAEAELDLAALVRLLQGHGFNPVAARGGRPAQMAAALAAGLAEAPEAQSPRPPAAGAAQPASDAPQAADPAQASEPAEAAAPTPEEAWSDTVPPDLFAAAEAEAAAEARQQQAFEAAQSAEQAAAAALQVAPSVPALIIDKPLRSGQRVYARGADLVVLAVVSHGAEVIADGNIHVYAPLRGRALAGARGDTSARIFAVRMEAQLLSIAGIWRTTEAGLPADVANQPAQVRLDGDKLVIEALKF